MTVGFDERSGAENDSLKTLAASLAAFRPDFAGDAQAVCLVLLFAPAEPGCQPPDLPLLERLKTALANGDSPECRCARLWLALQSGEAGDPAATDLADLLGAPLWEPAQAWALRGLAWLGARQRIAELLPVDGALNLAQAEAWLEAHHPGGRAPLDPARIQPAPDSPYPPDLTERWRALITVEAELASGSDLQSLEARLIAPLDLPAPETNPWLFNETQRLEARRLASLARLRAGQACNDGGALQCAAGARLPAWEHAWLQALSVWSDQHDLPRARGLLEQAVALAPQQSAPRLALASLLAAHEPQAALDLLGGALTRTMGSTRAALLARLGDQPGAAAQLAACDSLPVDALRQSWQSGAVAARRQEALLRAALAESGGSSAGALAAWRETGLLERRALQLSRQAYATRRELNGFSAPAWRRDVLRARAESALQAAAASHPGSDCEALFFQSLVLCATDAPTARRGFETLLRRADWLERECQAGGGRVLATIDALLALGHPRAALSGCDALEKHLPGAANSRRALARLLEIILSQPPDPDQLQSGSDDALAAFPDAPTPALLAAIGWLALDPSRSLALAQEARSRGADEAACRAIEGLARGESLPEEVITRLPAAAQPALRLVGGMGSARERLNAAIQSRGAGWLAGLPRDPREMLGAAVAELVEAGAWDEAELWAARLEETGQGWGLDLAARLRLRRALQSALDGDLAAAETALNRMASDGA